MSRRTRAVAVVAGAVVLAAAAGGYALASGGFSDVTFAGCLAGGKLSQVQVTRTPSCAATATPVQWAGQAVTGSPSPSPSTTSPSPSPTQTSPSPSPTSPSPTGTTAACVTSAPNGECGPYAYAPNTASGGYNTYVGNNVWNAPAGFTGSMCAAGSASPCQTLAAADPGNWKITANMPAGNTAVLSYPSSSQASSSDGTVPLVSSYTTLTSAFTESMPHNAGTSAWAAYDVWLSSAEVMIQTDFSSNGFCPNAAQASFTEPGTGTVQDWHLCTFGSELVWKLGTDDNSKINEASGSVDIGAMLGWLISHGYIPSSSTLGSIGYGWEICSTGGQAEDFTVSGFSLTALPNP
jgi:hypothetical protein